MKTIVRNILTDLERTRENLLALSDEIWLNIDHNNNEALQAGTQFKASYNDKMSAFDRLATDLSGLVQQFTDVRIEEESRPTEQRESNERLIQALDRETPHDLSEDFTYKRPFGFLLCGQGARNIVTWKQLYKLVCQTVLRLHAAPSPGVAREDGPPLTETCSILCSTPDALRNPLEVAEGIYVESNLSANHIREAIRKLLIAAAIPDSDLRIYLREDRDAQRGEDSSESSSDCSATKTYKILKNGATIVSETPGLYAGWRKGKLFGRLDCWSGKRNMKPENRVFFHTMEDAIREGYRPCHHCEPMNQDEFEAHRHRIPDCETLDVFYNRDGR